MVPQGQEVLTSGNKTISEGITTFEMSKPTDGINLFIGRYVVSQDHFDEVQLYTYFSSEDSGLSEKYLSAMKSHLRTYTTRFGSYPYETMSVVSGPLMEGLGFPGFTMIGERLLRIPNMEVKSLGHEILHNWFGNGVYPDLEKGNWTEGLVNYLHDYNISEKRSGGAIARRNLLKYYTLYTKNEESSLLEFRERDTAGAMGVGYFKAAFVFSMLQARLGADQFDEGLRSLLKQKLFKRASWIDLKRVLEKKSGQNLDPFFESWISKKGAPSIEITNVSSSANHPVSVEITSEPFFPFDLPVLISTKSRQEMKHYSIVTTPQMLELHAEDPIIAVTLDPSNTVLRKLLPAELPFSIANVLETNSELSVLFSDAVTPTSKIMFQNFLAKLGVKYREISSIEESIGPTILLGAPTRKFALMVSGWFDVVKDVPWFWNGSELTIAKNVILGGDDSAMFSWRGPRGVQQPLVWVMGYSEAGLTALSRRFGYFMTNSYVMFREGKRPKRGTWEPSENPLLVTFP